MINEQKEILIDEIRSSKPNERVRNPLSLRLRNAELRVREYDPLLPNDPTFGELVNARCQLQYGYWYSILRRNNLNLDSVDFSAPARINASAANTTRFRGDIAFFNRYMGTPTMVEEVKEAADNCFYDKVRQQVELRRKEGELDQDHREVNKMSWFLGIVVAFAYLTRKLRPTSEPQEDETQINGESNPNVTPKPARPSKSKKRRRDVLVGVIKEAVALAVPQRFVDLGFGLPSPLAKREKVDKGVERVQLLTEARDKLIGSVGLETVDDLVRVLGDKLSINILREIGEGNNKRLIALINRNAKPLGDNGLDCKVAISRLCGEIEETIEAETTTTIEEKLDHPLVREKARGWRRADFHQLLASHGFVLNEMNGNGHYFVKDRDGNKIREMDGRFVLVPGFATSTEVTPGTAKSIMKACARYAIEKGI
jgi:hypothetical protein